jgi:hypothetical protein
MEQNCTETWSMGLRGTAGSDGRGWNPCGSIFVTLWPGDEKK